MKIVAIAVLLVLVLSFSAFAAPVCKDINTGTVMECPADSSIMPWDLTVPGVGCDAACQDVIIWELTPIAILTIVAVIIF